MGKTTSKTVKKSEKARKSEKTEKSPKKLSVRIKNFRSSLTKKRASTPPRVKLHKSFCRSYREDYQRDLETPGIMYHIFATFRIIFKNWKLFLPLLVIVVALNILLIGLMSESTYTGFQDILDKTSAETGTEGISGALKAGLLLVSTISTGGLSGDANEGSIVFGIVVFLIIWLVTIYLLRHLLANHKIKLRDGLYNSMTPLISTFVVFLVALIESLPIIILVIVASVAAETEFLSTPFYALVFFVFAVSMILLSGYLLSSSLIALVAVSAPGLYPMKALRAASDLVAGRRIRFILRLLALFIALLIVWALVMLPLILFDLWIKTFEWAAEIPFIPLCLNIMTCFTCIYLTAYLYLYYRWMLKSEEN